jgi:hypothetical protein
VGFLGGIEGGLGQLGDKDSKGASTRIKSYFSLTQKASNEILTKKHMSLEGVLRGLNPQSEGLG